MKVVVLDSLFSSLDVEREAAAAHGAELVAWDGDRRSLADADVLAHVFTRVDRELLASAPRVRVVARFGTGLDTVADDVGVEVVGVRDYCVTELASQSLMLAFALVRRLRETEGRELAWDELPELRRRSRAAVVGVGAVGSRVADALEALDYDVTRVGRGDTFAGAELVLLHASLTPETKGMVDARMLEEMRGAILVNTARLGLLDEQAVAGAVEDGALAGLGLDARLPAASPLRRLLGRPNVLVTPHLGWYSAESATELRRRAIDDALTKAGA